MIPSRTGLLTAALLALLLLPLPAAGQQATAPTQQEVRGAVSEGGSLAPIEGAMILLLDEGGRRIGGVLSGVSGRFRVLVPAPGRYKLRVDRIGYGSMDTELFEVLAGASVEQRVVTSVKPIELAGIDVTGSSQCRVRPAQGVATHTVWEEARKALDAATWTSDRAVYSFNWARYTRQLDKEERVLSEKRSQSRGITSQPFAAANPEMLRDLGYVERLPDGQLQFWAPDANVLLSDAFLDTHCFSLQRKVRDGAAMLGLAFEPRDGRGRSDVEGVLWIDQATAQLRALEYHYVKVPAGIENQDSGGDLTFVPLPNGTWIVKEWRIRMPQVAQVRSALPRGTGTNSVASGGGSGGTSRIELRGYIEEGGIVQRAATPSGEVVLDDLNGGIRGVLTDDRGEPLGGTRVRLSGTSLDTDTDSLGVFAFAGVGAGTWKVVPVPVLFEAAGVEAVGAEAVVKSTGMTDVRLMVPTLTTAILDGCAATPPGEGQAVVVGRVLDPRNQPVAGAEVRITWQTIRGTGSMIAAADATATQVSNATGAFRFCAIPREETVTAQAVLGDRRSAQIKLDVSDPTEVVVLPLP